MRILIVEDDHDSARMLATYLSEFGQCDFAMDGVEALENVKLAFEEEEPYQLICMDIMMPNVDGQAALSQIRALEEKNAVAMMERAKVVMVTALSDNHNILKSFVNLSDGYVTKPFDRHDLVNKLSEVGLI
jgi:two-component system chemotaxis response regulator CheY